MDQRVRGRVRQGAVFAGYIDLNDFPATDASHAHRFQTQLLCIVPE